MVEPQGLILPSRKSTIYEYPTFKKSSVDGDLIIDSVIIRGTNTGDGRFWHFTIHFVGPRGASLRLNPSPSYTDMTCPMRCILTVEYIDKVNDYAGDGIEPFQVPAKAGTTLRAICHELLGEFRMDEYIFDNEGQGCRHWCATAIDHLTNKGFVDDSTPDLYTQYEEAQAQIHGSKFLMPRVRGTFYSTT